MYVIVVCNDSNSQALDASLILSAYFADQSIDYSLIKVSDLGTSQAFAQATVMCADVHADLAVVLGGDGTILRAARLLEGTEIPILGINFGRFGFLTNECSDSVVSLVASALSDELIRERRSNLFITVVCEGEPDPFGDEGSAENPCVDASEIASAPALDLVQDDIHPPFVGANLPSYGVNTEGLEGQRCFFALNEIAITRGALGRIIDFSLDINDAHIADIRGDGIVVATATGSTAYALSAGGPLVSPEFDGLITVPLSPHTLRARSFLTSNNDVVRVMLTSTDVNREVTLFADGDMLVFDKPVKCVYVRRGNEPTILLRRQGENFYEHAAQSFFSYK